MDDEPPHPGDALIATCLLLGVQFDGDEDRGFWVRLNGWSIGNFYCKRACAAAALKRMGYKIDVDGDVTKK